MDAFPGFRTVPRTGVIYVTHEATQLGFSYANAQWANLGQGSPETGAIPGAPPRVTEVTISEASRQYGPVGGNRLLCQAVADFYNANYRRGKRSQYTAENVSIASGGRLALTRLASALGDINMGHFIPDYTAYEELLSIFKAFTAIPILLEASGGYKISPDDLKEEILGRGLSALLVSNPCNPTGQLVQDDELAAWCRLARDCQCSMIFDEFYSHYIYTAPADIGKPRMVSAAEFVEDVERDPIVIVDGLTKNWRYPGWRISWTLGPRPVIEAIASAGSFLDGGANHPFQDAALGLLNPNSARAETLAIQRHFREKRRRLLAGLKELGIGVDAPPAGAFYVWANLATLPPPINDGMNFFREALKERVIIVPGVFFDVNPGNRRATARYQNHCRISFGPEMEKLERGLEGLARVVGKHRSRPRRKPAQPFKK
ncbi:MAG: pyridoxal phosphate-dependent aminotransferase [Verrucomicrobia bacterium]|nr:pyridoxal phosphate-dependent aminotransferase [Verrucomicrobiota bacterium]MDE3098729.1 pyridoxal phosphate-dependent aminotransferase [Verrucomicrobiota bacterium]